MLSSIFRNSPSFTFNQCGLILPKNWINGYWLAMSALNTRCSIPFRSFTKKVKIDRKIQKHTIQRDEIENHINYLQIKTFTAKAQSRGGNRIAIASNVFFFKNIASKNRIDTRKKITSVIASHKLMKKTCDFCRSQNASHCFQLHFFERVK